MNRYFRFRITPVDIFIWTSSFVFGIFLLYLLIHGQTNLLCAILIGTSFLVIMQYSRATAALYVLGYLILLGDVRRIADAAFGRPKTDFLLLVGPVLAIMLALPPLFRVRLRDTLSKAMLALLLLMTLEVFNPQQGGVIVGLSGGMFYIVPMLWFWAGRDLGTPRNLQRLLYNVVFPLAVAAAMLGLAQTYIGFLPFEQTWIDLVAKQYGALHVGGKVRAFGFSVSGAEYVFLIGIGCAGVAAAVFSKKRVWILCLPLLLFVLVLGSSRGLVLRLAFAYAFIWIFRRGRALKPGSILRVGVATVVILVMINVVASRFAPASLGSRHDSNVQLLLAHQVAGLAHPLDSRFSTLGIHGNMIGSGLLEGIKSPLGHGLGSTTLASMRFGGDRSVGSSEIDISDMFITLGLAGGLVYVLVVILALQSALKSLHVMDRAISLPISAILLCTLGSWLIGGQYSTSCLCYFLIGGLTYQDKAALPTRDTRMSLVRPAA